ncbi:hypothetical protein C8R43DRAFT_942443 [Mycena crocata]|nr:hypothetical protein C8R43DRAFT_942443 [Mycena crocata]
MSISGLWRFGMSRSSEDERAKTENENDEIAKRDHISLDLNSHLDLNSPTECLPPASTSVAIITLAPSQLQNVLEMPTKWTDTLQIHSGGIRSLRAKPDRFPVVDGRERFPVIEDEIEDENEPSSRTDVGVGSSPPDDEDVVLYMRSRKEKVTVEQKDEVTSSKLVRDSTPKIENIGYSFSETEEVDSPDDVVSPFAVETDSDEIIYKPPSCMPAPSLPVPLEHRPRVSNLSPRFPIVLNISANISTSLCLWIMLKYPTSSNGLQRLKQRATHFGTQVVQIPARSEMFRIRGKKRRITWKRTERKSGSEGRVTQSAEAGNDLLSLFPYHADQDADIHFSKGLTNPIEIWQLTRCCLTTPTTTSTSMNKLSAFPNEILNEILYRAFLTEDADLETLIEQRRTLSEIDNRCRAIIHGNAQYWDTITVHRSTSPHNLKMSIERSGGCELTLRVHAEPWTCKEPRTSVLGFHTLILPVLRQAMSRVRSLYVRALNHVDAVRTLDVLAHLGLPKLTQLKLHNWRHRAESGAKVSIPMMPNLATVVAEGMDPMVFGASMWRTVTTLKLSHIDNAPTRPNAAHILDVLATATSLISLHLDDIVDRRWDKKRVTIPMLEDFWLGCSDDASLTLAAPLVLPNLRRFRVDLMGEVTLGDLLNTCGGLILDSSTIELYVDHATDNEIMNFFSGLGPVRSLDLRYCTAAMSTGVLNHIKHKEGALPHLHMLRLSTHTDNSILERILKEGRLNPGFLLTTGIRAIGDQCDKRWDLVDGTLHHDDFLEDREEVRYGRWVNVDGTEYIEQGR